MTHVCTCTLFGIINVSAAILAYETSIEIEVMNQCYACNTSSFCTFDPNFAHVCMV